MGTGLNLQATATQNLMQEAYLQASEVQDASDIDHPILELFERDNSEPAGDGKWTIFPIKTGNPQASAARGGYNTAFTKALTENVKGKKFQIQAKPHFDIETLDYEALITLGPRGSKKYILGGADYAMQAEKNLRHQLAILLCRGEGNGFIGRVGSFSSTDGIVFETPADAALVEEGMGLVAASSKTATVRTVGSTGLIAAGPGNSVSGLVKFTGTVATEASGISVGDYLFYDWARTAASPAAAKVLMGIGGWVPSADPSSSENFFEVDRSGNIRLFGARVGARNKSYSDALTEAIFLNEQAGGRNDGKRVFLCAPKMKGNFMKELRGQCVESTIEGATPNMIFKSVKVNNDVDIVTDMAMPLNTGYLLQLDTWKLLHRGSRLINVGHPETGEMFAQRSGQDDYAVTAAAICELGCSAPNKNIRIDFDQDATF